MKRFLIINLIFLLSGSFLYSEEDIFSDNPLFLCPFIKSPVIDGSLDDSTWGDAFSDELMLNRGRGKISQFTKIFVGWNKENLYIAFHCLESNMERIIAQKRERDSKVYRDDCVEIFLDPGRDGQQVHHLITNTLGTKFDELEKGQKSKEWNPEWEVAIRKGKDFWNAEVSIPFSSLGIYPKKGDLWGMNLCREEKPLSEDSAWSPTERGFGTPEKFGLCLFGGKKAPVIKQLTPFRNILKEGASEVKDSLLFEVSGYRKGKFILKVCFLSLNEGKKVFKKDFLLKKRTKIKVDYLLKKGGYYQAFIELADDSSEGPLFRSRKSYFMVWQRDPRIVYLKERLDWCKKEIEKPKKKGVNISLLKEYEKLSHEIDKLCLVEKPIHLSSFQWEILTEDKFLKRIEELYKKIQKERSK